MQRIGTTLDGQVIVSMDQETLETIEECFAIFGRMNRAATSEVSKPEPAPIKHPSGRPKKDRTEEPEKKSARMPRTGEMLHCDVCGQDYEKRRKDQTKHGKTCPGPASAPASNPPRGAVEINRLARLRAADLKVQRLAPEDRKNLAAAAADLAAE